MESSSLITTLLRPQSAALVVIDMQEKLLAGIWERDRLVASVRILIQGARALGVPVLFTTQNSARLGTLPAALTEAAPDPACIDKMCFACTESGPFIAALEAAGRSQIILCGVETHICVNQTALGLLARGYQPHVVEDAVSSRTEQNRRIGLEKMLRNGVQPSSVEMALYEMLGEAGTEPFRQVLSLIK